MKIRKYKNSDIKEYANLVRNTFKKFNSKEGSKKGINWYLGFWDYTKNKEGIEKNLKRAGIIFVAVENNNIIGLVRGNNNRISNFFVNGKYHGRGIGRKLIEEFEKEAKKQKSKFIKVKASLFAVPVYKKLGYKKTTGIRKMHEIKIQPMKKEL